MDDVEEKFLRLRDVILKTGHSRATIYRMMAQGTFPRQISIGNRTVAWRLSVINRWMHSPTYASDEGHLAAECVS